MDQLIEIVGKAWCDLPKETIDNVFLSVMCSMRDALSCYGNNTVKLKHMNKSMLRKQNRLPLSILVPNELVLKGQALLETPDAFLPKEKEAYNIIIISILIPGMGNYSLSCKVRLLILLERWHPYKGKRPKD